MSVCLYSLKKYFETNTFPTALQTFFLIQQKQQYDIRLPFSSLVTIIFNRKQLLKR